MAPTRLPKSSQNPIKTCIKIGQIFDTPWEGYILRCRWIFGANIELTWLPNGIKFRYELANIDFVEFDNCLEDWLDFLGFGEWILGSKINKILEIVANFNKIGVCQSISKFE